MPRSAVTPEPQPYRFFGTFAGLPFWPGGLTLLSAAPGIGKTSWLLRMVLEAAQQGFPAALGCYEHTAEELKYRLRLQAEAKAAGAHSKANETKVESILARAAEAVLLPLSDQEDTIRGIEETLLQDYNFPVHAPALLAVDYLQRIPVVGVTSLVSEERRSGEAAAVLRATARRRRGACAVHPLAHRRRTMTTLLALVGALALAVVPIVIGWRRTVGEANMARAIGIAPPKRRFDPERLARQTGTGLKFNQLLFGFLTWVGGGLLIGLPMGLLSALMLAAASGMIYAGSLSNLRQEFRLRQAKDILCSLRVIQTLLEQGRTLTDALEESARSAGPDGQAVLNDLVVRLRAAFADQCAAVVREWTTDWTTPAWICWERH